MQLSNGFCFSVYLNCLKDISLLNISYSVKQWEVADGFKLTVLVEQINCVQIIDKAVIICKLY